MSKKVSLVQIAVNTKFSEQIKEGYFLILYLFRQVAFSGKVDTVVKSNKTASFNLTSIKYDDSRTHFAWTDILEAYLLAVSDLKPSDKLKADFIEQKELILGEEDKKNIRVCLDAKIPTILVLLKEGTHLPVSVSKHGVRVRRV